MKTIPLAVIAFSMASTAHVQALETDSREKIMLACPSDRSLRMADVDLAVASRRIEASQTARRQMLERARNMCAVGLTMATLVRPTSQPLASDRTLLSDK